jgi:hypothetical protein
VPAVGIAAVTTMLTLPMTVPQPSPPRRAQHVVVAAGLPGLGAAQHLPDAVEGGGQLGHQEVSWRPSSSGPFLGVGRILVMHVPAVEWR